MTTLLYKNTHTKKKQSITSRDICEDDVGPQTDRARDARSDAIRLSGGGDVSRHDSQRARHGTLVPRGGVLPRLHRRRRRQLHPAQRLHLARVFRHQMDED